MFLRAVRVLRAILGNRVGRVPGNIRRMSRNGEGIDQQYSDQPMGDKTLH